MEKAVMNIDDSIIKQYLAGSDAYARHWVYRHISESGAYLFEKPAHSQKEEIKTLCRAVSQGLADFEPYNGDLVLSLFPHWQERLDTMNVLLCVGCPEPYDAMVRTYGGQMYMIFDLVQLYRYQAQGMDIPALMRRLITHEAIHVCIRRDHPEAGETYPEKLRYIVFDEGFAHLLSFAQDIAQYDFKDIIQAHYCESVRLLRAVMKETDPQKQRQFLKAANTGRYWEKFAAISGKLCLAQHRDWMVEIYQSGPDGMITDLLEQTEI